VLAGIARWLEATTPRGIDAGNVQRAFESLTAPKKRAAELLGSAVPARPPGFCVGCPERPVFTAMKLLERETGAFHVSADIGCHTFSTLPPFNIGNTVLGYGLGLASNSAIAPMFGGRTVTIMGDGGFWHNGLTSGIANAVFNRDDGILVIMKNGYTSATGTQNIPSSPHQTEWKSGDMGIERALKGVGAEWVKSVYTYRVAEMAKTLRDAMTTTYKGLKVIIADAECQLERQRRLRPRLAALLKAGKRVVRTRFGVDEDICSGDHSCIRLSGCPSLTIRPSSDPLKVDPVAQVNDSCVGCGLCGEVAHAAVLCPSFFRAEIVQNPNVWDRMLARFRNAVIGWMQGREARSTA
jgi:indolepyruvate ferredoxin oxidoreductase alpha subunit